MINTEQPQKANEFSMDSANRFGSQRGMSLQQREKPNPEETTAVPIWRRPDGQASILYDPWCTNHNAQVVHGHYHTSWARNIHFAAVKGLFKKPALFYWKDKTIFIIGRGSSAEKNVEALNSVERKNPAIFVSSAYVLGPQPIDFVMIADNRILTPGHAVYNGAINNPLISFPGIDHDITGDDWKGVYGFNPWTRSPLNDFMREIFPHLPTVLDILCTAVMASHLACLNFAKNVVYVGMDNTMVIDPENKRGDIIETKDIHGEKCTTIQGYYEMATAVCQFAGLARFHCDTKFFNATGDGILGVNYFENENGEKETLFPWMEQITMEEAIERFEDTKAE